MIAENIFRFLFLNYLYLYFEFCVLNSRVQTHHPLCSQIYFLSEQYILYMMGRINSPVDQSIFSYFIPIFTPCDTHSNKEFLEILMNISIFQDTPKNHEDVSKLFY